MMPLTRTNSLTDNASVLRTTLILLIGVSLGILGMVLFPPRTRGPAEDATGDGTTNAAGASPRKSIVALGSLQPRDGIIQISSPLVGYQIKSILVQEGQSVKAGDALVELDDSPAKSEYALAASQLTEALERQQAEVELAKQRVAAAELAVQQATDGRQLEFDAQKSRVAVAEARKKQAAKDLERVKELSKLPEKLAADQQVEQQQLMVDAAAAEEEAGRSALKRLEQSLNFQEQTAAAELRAAKQSLTLAEKGTGVESLRRRVELSELKLKQTTISAPTAGVVLGVQAHPGEVVAQQPLLQIANLDNLICQAEVDTADVPYLQANQKATVSCRTFQGNTLDGTVERLGNQVSAAGLRPLDPRQPVDRDVTKVVVSIDSKKAARLINLTGNDRRSALVGLQVEVVFPLTK